MQFSIQFDRKFRMVTQNRPAPEVDLQTAHEFAMANDQQVFHPQANPRRPGENDPCNQCECCQDTGHRNYLAMT